MSESSKSSSVSAGSFPRTIREAHELLTKGTLSCRELAERYCAEIKRRDPDIHAYLEVFGDIAAQAEAAQERIRSGNAMLLTGIPLAVKDNILIEGKRASSASRILENYTATYDATAIKKLKAHDAVFLGRTNMDEFAMGGSTENSAFGITRNPLDPARVPGGSSGGSAAAVAGGMALAALGSDTGGSIRQPASFCGIVGLKPTYGAVSRYGLMAMASSLDQIGPFARTVDDAETLFNAIRGHDSFDSTSAPTSFYRDRDYADTKLTIGIPDDFVNTEGVDEDVRKNFYDSLAALGKAGCLIKNVKLPSLKYALAVYYIIMPAEASTNLARFDGVRYGFLETGDTLFADYAQTRGHGFGKEVRRRIMLGTYVLSSGYYDAYYRRAENMRRMIARDLDRVFVEEKIHALAMPTTPQPAFKIGEKTGNPLQMYLADIFTVPPNLAGVPAISVPSGTVERDGTHLPLGIQFVGPHFSESLLFEAGRRIERARDGAEDGLL